ncbi:unnamed protein product [Calypogeia fissa]
MEMIKSSATPAPSSPAPSAGPAQESTADLISDLRRMINNPKFSDIIFLCQDRVPVHASRLLLAARSPIFMREVHNKEREFSVPDISSSTMLSIFEFVYTGTMIEHAPASFTKAYEVIRAAKYFELGAMEELVREFLTNKSTDIDDDRTKDALKLSLALECGTVGAAILDTYVLTLNYGQLEPAQLEGLSEKAFTYFLRRTQQSMTSDPEMVSFREYLRFRHIILWCLTRVCPDDAARIAKLCLPDAKAAAHLLREERETPFLPREYTALPEANYVKNILVRRKQSAILLQSLLTMVDFRRIHPELLDTVVEPLNLAPAEQMEAAFRFQALQKGSTWEATKAQLRERDRPRQSSTNWTSEAELYQWEHGSSYTVVGDGLVLKKIERRVGFARFNVPIAHIYDVYEWDIIVEELCTTFCEIGFHSMDQSQNGKPNFDDLRLSQYPTGYALSHDYGIGTRISKPGEIVSWRIFNKDIAHKGARIRVQLNMSESRCSFSVDGDEFSPAWKKLPHGVYFPAVSLGQGSVGRVRIELVKGFDMQ